MVKTRSHMVKMKFHNGFYIKNQTKTQKMDQIYITYVDFFAHRRWRSNGEDECRVICSIRNMCCCPVSCNYCHESKHTPVSGQVVENAENRFLILKVLTVDAFSLHSLRSIAFWLRLGFLFCHQYFGLFDLFIFFVIACFKKWKM